MNIFKIILRSLFYHRRNTYLSLVGGTVAAAVLTGALVIGDSMRGSLRHIALERLGRISEAVPPGTNLFRQELAKSIQDKSGVTTAGILLLSGAASSESGKVGQAKIIGAEENFFQLSQNRQAIKISRGTALLNSVCAKNLKVKNGDDIILRITQPSDLPTESIYQSLTKTKSMRLRIAGILDKESLANFGLLPHQIPDNNIFVNYKELSETCATPEKINSIVCEASKNNDSASTLQIALAECITLEDLGLRILKTKSGCLQLESNHFFLNNKEIDAAYNNATESRTILSYLVNSISTGKISCPYSTVSAISADCSDVPPAATRLQKNETAITEWLAKDLELQVGDRINLSWFVPESAGSLNEEKEEFTVAAIISESSYTADKNLFPAVPGLTDAENCSDWDTDLPFDMSKVRDEDEEYWNRFGAAPKLFINFNTAERLWQNKYGFATAVRFAVEKAENISQKIISSLITENIGPRFLPVRKNALEAAQKSVDFSQLFLGLGFFIIVSALIVCGMVFSLAVSLRSQEIGFMRAVGFTQKKTAGMFFTEAAMLASLASLCGVPLGLGYAKLMLYFLGGAWQGATGTSALLIYASPQTLIIAFVSGAVCSLAAAWIAAKKIVRRNILKLQQDTQHTAEVTTDNRKKISSAAKRLPLRSLVPGSILVILSIIVAVSFNPQGKEAAAVFFITGALCLAGLSLLLHSAIYFFRSKSRRPLSPFRLALTNLCRRPALSIVVSDVLALSIFLVIAVGANQRDVSKKSFGKDSGTGGFSFYAETSSPLGAAPMSTEGRKLLNISDKRFDNVNIVPLRTNTGTDASCLNLNMTAHPRVLGINPDLLQGRFSANEAWQMLGEKTSPDESKSANAVCDKTVLEWGLEAQTVDSLKYINGEGGEVSLILKSGIPNSIFQGNVIISDAAFKQLFPEQDGWKVFLIECPDEIKEEVKSKIEEALFERGLLIEGTAERLARFSRVEQTYLSIFLALGGVGLLLGSVAFGVLAARNINERRGEAALMRACGFGRRKIISIVAAEHIMLMLAGLVSGIVSGLLAIAPAFASDYSAVPFDELAAWCLLIIVSGAGWILLITARSMSGEPLDALRTE